MERRKEIDFEKILAERAARLGISIEEARQTAPPEPQFLRGAVDKPNVDLPAVLATDAEHGASEDYPTPDCLEPHEVELLVAGTLDTARHAHVQECAMCEAMVRAVQPDPERLAKFMEQVRALSITALGQSDQATGIKSLLKLLENCERF